MISKIIGCWDQAVYKLGSSVKIITQNCILIPKEVKITWRDPTVPFSLASPIMRQTDIVSILMLCSKFKTSLYLSWRRDQTSPEFGIACNAEVCVMKSGQRGSGICVRATVLNLKRQNQMQFLNLVGSYSEKALKFHDNWGNWNITSVLHVI